MATGINQKLTSLAGSTTTPEAIALWGLLALELGAQVALRKYFKRHHGG